ncbi:ankyrin repeat-containing domain protein [Phaeosphaeria sp. MPI-PUGE-AT-0046c]|nr:ankyrin repeat-containing domain protein [Phaeosphaeria sp. MPI-PUGE-AT-0046c]
MGAWELATSSLSTQDEIRQALLLEYDPKAPTKTLWALSKASWDGNLNAAQRLVRAGARIHHRRYSAVIVAVGQGHIEVVKYLLTAERDLIARLGYSPESLEAADLQARYAETTRLAEAQTFLDDATYNKNIALFESIRKGDLNIVRLLVEHGAEISAHIRGRTPLRMAAKHGHLSIVEYFVDQGTCTNSDISVAKRFAAAQGFVEIVKVLQKSISGLNDLEALSAAAGGGYIQLVELLLETTRETLTHHFLGPSNYNPALHAASAGGYLDIVKMLRQAGADVNAYVGSKENTALQAAIKNDHVHIVKFLIAHGAKENPKAPLHDTSLETAARIGSIETMEVLLNARLPNSAQSSIRNAATEGRLATFERLLRRFSRSDRRSADESEDTDWENWQQITNDLLGQAVRRGWEQIVKSLLSEASIKSRINEHTHLVFNATRQGQTAIVRLFLEAGVNVNRPLLSTLGQPLTTLLHAAVSAGHEDIVRLLLQYDADVDAAHARKKPPLHIACRRGHVEIARLLIDHGANVESISRKGKSAHYYAEMSRNSDLIGLIEQHLDLMASPVARVEHHKVCRAEFNPNFRPSRLVDVRLWRSEGHIQLVCVKTQDADGMPYIALSHRWNQNVKLTSTTSSNFAERLLDIKPDSLPDTFLHTFTVATTLQIEYVWIDSLCIIQDSTDDWSKESALMSKVYRNAYCTISANKLDAGDKGLFHSGLGALARQFSLKTKYEQLELHHRGSIKQRWDDALQTAALQIRGWCLQEREMSPRIIHWTEQEIAWECRVAKATESLPEQMDLDWSKLKTRDKRSWDGLQDMEIKDVYNEWHRTVERYTKMYLTDERDTLPALSGLANVIHSTTQSGYRAGLWADDLQRSLAWHSIERQQSAKRPHYRHARYIAPSWSWAAIHGSVQYSISMEAIYVPPIPLVDEGIAVITHHTTNLSSLDSYGAVESGELHLYGPVVWACSSSARDKYDYAELRCIPGHEAIVCCFDIQAERYDYSLVMCIVLFCDSSDSDGSVAIDAKGVGLALVPVDGRANTYRRVGYVELLNMDLFRVAPKQDIFVV